MKKKDKNAVEEESSFKINNFHVSKNQLKKIKDEGHFGGRNIINFTDEGKKVTIDDMRI